jgi:hypothetical protein
LEDLDVDGKMILKSLKGIGWGAWTELIYPEKKQVAGSCKHGNEIMGSTKCGDFLTN